MLLASTFLALALAPQETAPPQAVPDEPDRPEFVSLVPS